MKKIIVILLLYLSMIPTLYAVDRNYYFENFSVQDGLSQSTVNAILQDKEGFLWFGTKDGLNRYDGQVFRQYKFDSADPYSLGNNFVTSLYEDVEGNIWVGTDVGLYIYHPDKELFEHFGKVSQEGTRIERSVSTILGGTDGCVWVAVETQGLFCYNLQTQILVNHTLEKFQGISTNVKSLAFDNSGTLWIGFYGDGLYYSDDHLSSLHPYISEDGEEVFDNDVVIKMVSGTYNRLYIGSTHGVQELNLTSGKVREILHVDEGGENIYCRDLLMVSDDKLWVGTESGVYIYDVQTNQYVHLRSSSDDPYSLSDNAIYSLYKDREDGIWVGSYFGGINYYPKPYTYFEKYYPKQGNGNLHGMRVREFCQDNQGILWIGTEDGGLNRFNPETKEFSFFKPSIGFTNIHGLCLVGDELWVGTFSKGIKVIDTHSGILLRTYQKDASPHSLVDNSIFSICRTTAGEIFLGTMFGLLHYDKQIDGFNRVSELNGCFVYDIKEDYEGNLWLATYANGAWKYDVSRKLWRNYVHNDADSTSLPYDKVLSIFEDSNHGIWLTTQGGGFCRYNRQGNNFISFGSRNGLPNDVVYQIAEDKDGLFWLTTNRGLACFDPFAGNVKKVYTTESGLLGDQFNYRSSYVSNDGTIYLGCIDGFIAFNPKNFAENKYLPPVVVTDFMLFNQRVHAAQQGSPLAKSIVVTDRVSLRSNQNSFSLRIAALSYQAPRMNKLMYKLDGFDENWLTVQGNSLINYSNLPYGKYVFRVKGSNNDGIWNQEEKTLQIRILPPLYLTGWAYSIYIILFMGCLFYTVWYFRQRSNRKHRRQIEKFEQEKEREIYRAKFDFFTNVAHEIRTPLTLIKGPLENILKNKKVDTETREDLNIMQQNTERLLYLTNQLLDFRKAESQGYRLNFSECNITQVLHETYLRFTSIARQKNLNFTLNTPEQDFYAHVNREAFTKILSNLLNNAVKYAATYIHVCLQVEEHEEGKGFFSVCTVNDGTLIPNEMKEAIFKPFVRFQEQSNRQMTTGTGIGLALSRSLAELHHGSLVMSDKTDVNEFCLTLPVVQASAIVLSNESDRYVKPEELQNEHAEKKESKFVVLVVEDNPSVLSFVSRQMARDYEVLTASDGAEALMLLDKHFVNLVVSDVMMPVMDGFELCKTIKANLNYSHIPVILLTAKTDMQFKIEGLEIGADAYIEKPFSPEYLSAVVANLINNREKLRQSFAKSPFVAVNTMALTKTDEEFIRKLNEVILANLGNPEFATDDMADSLNMSRSNFYRKIKGVLDLTPNEYLRIERLKRAAQLLKEGECRVNEVCYTVGFNSPSYFAKCFLKQFGVLPKDFVK